MAAWDPVAEGDTSELPAIELEPGATYRLTLAFALPDWVMGQAIEWAKAFGVGLSTDGTVTTVTFLA